MEVYVRGEGDPPRDPDYGLSFSPSSSSLSSFVRTPIRPNAKQAMKPADASSRVQSTAGARR